MNDFPWNEIIVRLTDLPINVNAVICMHGHATNFIEDLTKLSMHLIRIISSVHVGME